MDKIIAFFGKLLYTFTAPTPAIYKFVRNVWACILSASAVILKEASTGVVLSEHLLLAAKVALGISGLGIIHAQAKVDPNAITPPATNTTDGSGKTV